MRQCLKPDRGESRQKVFDPIAHAQNTISAFNDFESGLEFNL